MPQYIDVSTPVKNTRSTNIALKELLKFLGEKYKKAHKSIRINNMKEFSAGLEYINKECKKYHKTAIRHIILSARKATIDGDEYRKWKFHKHKVKRFLEVLYRTLKRENAPTDIFEKYDELYQTLSKEYSNIQPKGSEVASFPYYHKLKYMARTTKDKDEKQVLAEIISGFEKLDDFYS